MISNREMPEQTIFYFFAHYDSILALPKIV